MHEINSSSVLTFRYMDPSTGINGTVDASLIRTLISNRDNLGNSLTSYLISYDSQRPNLSSMITITNLGNIRGLNMPMNANNQNLIDLNIDLIIDEVVSANIINVPARFQDRNGQRRFYISDMTRNWADIRHRDYNGFVRVNFSGTSPLSNITYTQANNHNIRQALNTYNSMDEQHIQTITNQLNDHLRTNGNGHLLHSITEVGRAALAGGLYYWRFCCFSFRNFRLVYCYWWNCCSGCMDYFLVIVDFLGVIKHSLN
ncbi:hypothetical protein [Spiroplasma endosymbiont of Eupeodes luniger]|uniref:hypothetical protein n=1 Tax=Spiroplasma endosymbiont of Eupeodes luniger TaxID=3066300 RepID=UPI0030D5A6F3